MRPQRPLKKQPRLGGLDGDQLVDQHWDTVYRLAYHLCRDPHDAQDLAQETFLKALARADSFKEGTNLRAWLLRIASNAFLDLKRKRKTARVVPLEVEPPGLSHDPAQNSELEQMLMAAIANLDDTQKTVFVLRTREELSFRDIAGILDCTEETARWHMMQARRRLIQLLEGKL